VCSSDLVEALRAHRGVLASTARHLGVSRQQLRVWVQSDPELSYAKEAAIEELVDVAEGNLWKAVEDGDLRASMFALRTLGSNRGFGTNGNVFGNQGGYGDPFAPVKPGELPFGLTEADMKA